MLQIASEISMRSPVNRRAGHSLEAQGDGTHEVATGATSQASVGTSSLSVMVGVMR